MKSAAAVAEEQSPPRIQPLLKDKEAARILDVRPNTLAYWRATKKVNLPYIVLSSGAIRYKLSAIEKFLEERTVGTDGKVPEGVVRHVAGPGRPPKRRRNVDAVPEFLLPQRGKKARRS
jgi:hypothetical protein